MWPLASCYQQLQGLGLIIGQFLAALQTTLFTFSSCPQSHPVPLVPESIGLPRAEAGEGCEIEAAALDRWTESPSHFRLTFWRCDAP